MSTINGVRLPNGMANGINPAEMRRGAVMNNRNMYVQDDQRVHHSDFLRAKLALKGATFRKAKLSWAKAEIQAALTQQHKAAHHRQCRVIMHLHPAKEHG